MGRAALVTEVADCSVPHRDQQHTFMIMYGHTTVPNSVMQPSMWATWLQFYKVPDAVMMGVAIRQMCMRRHL
jgi:hypothetical protein